MRRWIIFIFRLTLLLVLLHACLISNIATARSGNIRSAKSKIRIGVLFIDTPTGNRHWRGVKDAYDNHPFADRITLKPLSYINENQGLDLLLNLIRDTSDTAVAIVLGPTESDIFVRAFDRQEELSPYSVPVISGLVTANVANDKDGWFFRTNVDVTRRVHAISDFLYKHWIRSVAVIYATTEFGKRAELAFENYLKIRRPGQVDRYISLAYETPPNPRVQLDEILDNRPEAVGFFGEREDIEHIYPLLQAMNQGVMPYDPLFFTILDTRNSADSIANIYFVSVTMPESSAVISAEKCDDVKALGFDTAALIFDELQKLKPSGSMTPEERRRFRDQFAKLLNRSGPHKNTKTKMSFNNFANSTWEQVFHMKQGGLERIEIATTFGWFKKVGHKIMLVKAIYGWLPIICVAILLLIAITISSMDVAGMYTGSKVKFYKSWVFYLFMGAHFIVGVSLYIFFAENGTIRYSNILAAAIIGLAPFTLLRTTFFETHKGQAISLEPLYKKVLAVLDRMIMRSRYKALQARINIIAYHNSQNRMIKILKDHYAKHRIATESARLLEEFDKELKNEPSYFNRRRICAYRLLKIYGWSGVKADGLAPRNADDDDPEDPQKKVWELAKKYAGDPDKVKTIDNTITKLMKELKDTKAKRYRELEDFRKYELKNVIATDGEVNVNIRFLFTLFGYDEKRLLEELNNVGEKSNTGELREANNG